MKAIKLIFSLGTILLFVQCGNFSPPIKSGTIVEKQNKLRDDIQFRQVYRYPDEQFQSLSEKLSSVDIEGFMLYNADSPTIQDCALGTTVDKVNRVNIKNKLLKADTFLQSSELIWTFKAGGSLLDNSPAYELLYLKPQNPDYAIDNTMILRAKAQTNNLTNEPIINLSLSNRGAKNLANLTKDCFYDNANYIAIIIKDEVYTCASVKAMIMTGNMTIAGFETIEEAEELIK